MAYILLLDVKFQPIRKNSRLLVEPETKARTRIHSTALI